MYETSSIINFVPILRKKIEVILDKKFLTFRLKITKIKLHYTQSKMEQSDKNFVELALSFKELEVENNSMEAAYDKIKEEINCWSLKKFGEENETQASSDLPLDDQSRYALLRHRCRSRIKGPKLGANSNFEGSSKMKLRDASQPKQANCHTISRDQNLKVKNSNLNVIAQILVNSRRNLVAVDARRQEDKNYDNLIYNH